MKLFVYIWNKKWYLLLGALALSFVFLVYNGYHTHYSESVTFALIYPNSEKGKYPDNTRLNIYDLLSEQVLNTAVENYNKEKKEKRPEITVEDVAGHIKIVEHISSNLQEEIEAARKNGQAYSYFINEFDVTCPPINRFSFTDFQYLFGIFPYVDNQLLLEKIYDSYSSYITAEHAEMNIIERLSNKMNFDGYDYLEYTNTLNSQISTYLNYLNAKNSENGAFVSSTTGASFNDLITEFTNLKNYQIYNLSSFVSSSKLAKNTEEFVNIKQTDNESKWIQYLKYQGEADFARKAMLQYDHTFEENIVITGIDEKVGLYQARPKTAYDTITQRALSYEVSAKNLQTDISENDRAVKEYTNTDLSQEERARLVSVADSLITEINQRLSELIQKANATVEDFLKSKSSDYISSTPVKKAYLSLPVLIRCGMMFLLGALLSLIAVVLYELLKDQYRILKKNQTLQRQLQEKLQVLANVKEGERVSDYTDPELSEEENINDKEEK